MSAAQEATKCDTFNSLQKQIERDADAKNPNPSLFLRVGLQLLRLMAHGVIETILHSHNYDKRSAKRNLRAFRFYGYQN